MVEHDKLGVRVIHRCGLSNGFGNKIPDFHGVRVIHRCGLNTGNYSTFKAIQVTTPSSLTYILNKSLYYLYEVIR